MSHYIKEDHQLHHYCWTGCVGEWVEEEEENMYLMMLQEIIKFPTNISHLSFCLLPDNIWLTKIKCR